MSEDLILYEELPWANIKKAFTENCSYISRPLGGLSIFIGTQSVKLVMLGLLFMIFMFFSAKKYYEFDEV